MKLFTRSIFVAFSLLFAIEFAAQPAFPGYEDYEPGVNALTAAISITDIDPPTAAGQDSIAAVDADDSFDFLGKGGADADGGGNINAILAIDEPTGPSNSFHLVYFDGSEGTYHIIQDGTGAPASYAWGPSMQPGDETFVMGFEVNGGNFTEAMPTMPGEADFNTTQLILPVELVNFTGASTKDAIRLDWATASERDNDYFTVQRANTGGEFYTVGTVGGDNLAQGAHYEFIDETPAVGTNYYRLLQTDLDGTVNDLNAIISVSFAGDLTNAFTVFPNPATTALTIRLDEVWGDAQVNATLYDAKGRQVTNWTVSAGADATVSIADLSAGLYQLHLTSPNQTVSTRVVIE